MLLPVLGVVQGDTTGLLILANDTDTVAHFAAALQRAAAVRIAPRSTVAIFKGSQRLSNSVTLAQAGVQVLERLDLVEVGPDELPIRREV